MENRLDCTYELDEIDNIAQEIVSRLVFPICTFKGEMGTGKTSLLKAICKKMNVVDEVTSPTYSIVQHYLTQDGKNIYHFDLFRIKQEIELYDMGFGDYLESGDPCFIEWPNLGKHFYPIQLHQVEITLASNNCRRLIFK